MKLEPIRMTVGFAIRALMVADGMDFQAPFPSARKLAAMSKRHPELCPEPWTLEACRKALTNPDATIEVAKPKKKFCATCSHSSLHLHGWTCRDCGAQCCAHRCLSKVGTLATCQKCAREKTV